MKRNYLPAVLAWMVNMDKKIFAWAFRLSLAKMDGKKSLTSD